MVSATTEGVRVSVETFFLANRSDPDERRWAYAYRITIENFSERTLQLLRRHWVVTNASNEVMEVDGDGVVGEQPVLEPGDDHTYTSGTLIETSTGSMEGWYEMVDAAGNGLRVQIPLFVLGTPDVLH